ncbi:hypothetical protein BB560_005604 [Smittium megazygosporum]|uniref:Uncharacterized protein n=1 Tax=Smittium megazygosporum TaxID=133381 RepID=A0A2T9Z2N3_9FUNG|nr:hypothetical protein BB560_005604 [Smittium megazygosporum]
MLVKMHFTSKSPHSMIFLALLSISVHVSSAPVFNVVNKYDVHGNLCPLPTLMRLECPRICVTDTSLCPESIRPSCAGNQVYCADGTCKDVCDTNLVNPCDCGYSTSLISSNTASMVPCLDYIARRVQNFNSSDPNAIKKSCLSYLDSPYLDDWSFNSTSKSVYLTCPVAPTPPLTYREPIFIAFWGLVNPKSGKNEGVSNYILLSNDSDQFVAGNNTQGNSNSLNHIRNIDSGLNDEKHGSMFVQNNTSTASNIFSTPDKVLAIEKNCVDNKEPTHKDYLKITGLKKNFFGTLALLSTYFTMFGLFMIVLLLCLDYYGLVTKEGAGLTHLDYNYSGIIFIIVWTYMAIYVIILVVKKDNLKKFFKLQTCLSNAEYIQVERPKDSLIFESKNYKSITKFVLQLDAFFSRVLNKLFTITTSKVITTESSMRYFSYNSSRFLYNPEIQNFESKSFSYWSTVDSILSLKGGLTTQEAKSRIEYIGLNFIPVKVTPYYVAVFQE